MPLRKYCRRCREILSREPESETDSRGRFSAWEPLAEMPRRRLSRARDVSRRRALSAAIEASFQHCARCGPASTKAPTSAPKHRGRRRAAHANERVTHFSFRARGSGSYSLRIVRTVSFVRRSLAALSLAVFAGCAGHPTAPLSSARASSSTASARGPHPEQGDGSGAPVVLTPLFTKQSRPKFPKAAIGDHECWQGLQLSGNAKTDYDNLIAHCGTPTGVVEYAHPATGHLHHAKNQRDVFKVQLAGGFCYRYFAVGDASIEDLDILVEDSGGDLVGDDRSNGPVAIIQSDKPWCNDDDVEYDLHVGVHGHGEGDYIIGVWARPKASSPD